MERKGYFQKDRKKGMTMVDVLISIFIFTMAMEGFMLLYVRSWRQNAFIIEEGITAAAVSRAVNIVVSDLRKVRQSDAGGYPIQSGSDFDLVVFLDIDNDGATEKVHYFLEGNTLKQGVSEPIAGTPITYPAGDDTVTTLATSVINAANQPVFSYYNKDYPGDTVNNPLETPLAVEEARLIKVHLLMNIDPLKAPDNINIESFAELRNLNDY